MYVFVERLKPWAYKLNRLGLFTIEIYPTVFPSAREGRMTGRGFIFSSEPVPGSSIPPLCGRPEASGNERLKIGRFGKTAVDPSSPYRDGRGGRQIFD